MPYILGNVCVIQFEMCRQSIKKGFASQERSVFFHGDIVSLCICVKLICEPHLSNIHHHHHQHGTESLEKGENRC